MWPLAALQMFSSIGGQMAAQGDRDAALDSSLTGQRAYSNINTPDPEAMKLLLEQYASSGQLTPEQLQQVQLSMQDQLSNVETDPRLKQAQMDALGFMQKTGQGDLTPTERAEVNNLRRKTEADSQSRLQAMLQQQDSRGVGSSDMALAARMLDAQGSANRQAQSTDDISAAAFQRALQSMSSGAQLASNMESADYGRQAALAEAERNRELANFSNQQNISNQNVQARNNAQQFNLQNAQQLSNSNVDLRNKQQEYNKQLAQQDFDNQMRKAAGLSGASQVAATAQQAKGDKTAGMFQGIGAGIGQIGAANMAGINKPTATPTTQTATPNALDLDSFLKKNRTV